jgi:hypothetical protein
MIHYLNPATPLPDAITIVRGFIAIARNPDEAEALLDQLIQAADQIATYRDRAGKEQTS